MRYDLKEHKLYKDEIFNDTVTAVAEGVAEKKTSITLSLSFTDTDANIKRRFDYVFTKPT